VARGWRSTGAGSEVRVARRRVASALLRFAVFVRGEGNGYDMTPKARPVGLGIFLLLSALESCIGCFATSSAIRNFGSSIPEGSIVTLTPSDSPARFLYEVGTRHGEMQLPDDMASRCTRVAAFSMRLFPEKAGYCDALDPNLPPTPEPPAGSLCKLPPTEAPECAVIFYRSASATADAPVVAYRADGSRLNVVSRRTDTISKWFALAVSPVIDTVNLAEMMFTGAYPAL
jgi:hypothetical protein